MSLIELQKTERRDRILTEARRLMALRGWAGMTMRDLAQASRVSVPTVYNLVGGKEALLGALMEALFAEVSEAGLVSDGDVVARARTLWRGGLVPLMDAPEYARELVTLFASSPTTSALRRHHGDRYVQLMATVLAGGQRRGELSRLVAPARLARTMYSLWVAQTIRWAHGDIDTEALREAVDLGLSLLLLGVAEGDARVSLCHSLEQLGRASGPGVRKTQGVA